MSGSFDIDGVNTALDRDRRRAGALPQEPARRRARAMPQGVFRRGALQVAGLGARHAAAGQALPHRRRTSPALVEAFHTVHDRVYAVRDEAERGRVRQLARHDLDPARRTRRSAAGKRGRGTSRSRRRRGRPISARTRSARRRCSAASTSSPATPSRARRSSRSRPRPSWSIRRRARIVSPSGHYILKS